MGEVLVNAHGIALTRQDLLTISDSGWLNDKVGYPLQRKLITFILQYRPSTYTWKLLIKKYQGVFVYSTFFYTKLSRHGYSGVSG